MGASVRAAPARDEPDPLTLSKKIRIHRSLCTAYNTKRERSRSRTRPWSARSTYGLSTTIRAPAASGPAKEISSSTVSRIVWRRRAPMFSRFRFTSAAARAISPRPSSAKTSSMPSAARSAADCFGSACSGSVRMRRKSSVGERVERDPDRKAALQLGDHVGRLRDVEGARRDEKDVVRPHHPVLRLDRRSLDEREEIPLDALARDVGPAAGALLARDLVDLVQKDDARLLRAPHGLLGHGRLVGQGVGLALTRSGRASDTGSFTFFFFCAPKRFGSMPGRSIPISSMPCGVMTEICGVRSSATSSSTSRASCLPS